MRPRRLLRLLSDFDCKIRYHPGKASVAADALSINERAKPLRKLPQWPVMEEGITTYVSKCLMCLKMRNDHPKPSGLLLRHDLGNRDHQEKNYADVRRKPLEFQIGDKAMLKLDEIQIDDTLYFIEEPVEIMNHKVKRLKWSRILIVKVTDI
ncbi:hypothetical protein Tco_1318584 [Tanacetum coccineum]